MRIVAAFLLALGVAMGVMAFAPSAQASCYYYCDRDYYGRGYWSGYYDGFYGSSRSYYYAGDPYYYDRYYWDEGYYYSKKKKSSYYGKSFYYDKRDAYFDSFKSW